LRALRRRATCLSTWFRDYVDFTLDAERIPPPSAVREALVRPAERRLVRRRVDVPGLGLYHAAPIALERSGLGKAPSPS
jgi:hypothetical protein